jgi:hypothetical protein
MIRLHAFRSNDSVVPSLSSCRTSQGDVRAGSELFERNAAHTSPATSPEAQPCPAGAMVVTMGQGPHVGGLHHVELCGATSSGSIPRRRDFAALFSRVFVIKPLACICNELPAAVHHMVHTAGNVARQGPWRYHTHSMWAWVHSGCVYSIHCVYKLGGGVHHECGYTVGVGTQWVGVHSVCVHHWCGTQRVGVHHGWVYTVSVCTPWVFVHHGCGHTMGE